MSASEAPPYGITQTLLAVYDPVAKALRVTGGGGGGGGETPATDRNRSIVDASDVSQLVFDTNPLRLGVVAFNTSVSAMCFVEYIADAAEDSFVYAIGPKSNWVMDKLFTGVINAVWGSGFDPATEKLIASELIS